MAPEAVGYWRDERVYWSRELGDLTRGLVQLRQLLERARAEADLEAVGYYLRVIGEYERKVREARRNVMGAVVKMRTLVPAVPSVPMESVSMRARPRARESRPTRRARRGAALGDRPRLSDDDDPDPVDVRGAAA